jgi:ankyrin repeat protein
VASTSSSLSSQSSSDLKRKTPSLSSQGFLDTMIRARGYTTNTFNTLQSAYYQGKPTALQVASYHANLITLIKNKDYSAFAEILNSGISANPCSANGESLLHQVCRMQDARALQCLLDAGACVSVANEFGRTPLHECCWAAASHDDEPNFDVADLLLRQDKDLLYATDCSGAAPLSYVKPEHWAKWNQFLALKKDDYWPLDCAPGSDDDEAQVKHYKDPETAVTQQLAAILAKGKMRPSEAKLLTYGSVELEVSDGEEDDDTKTGTYSSAFFDDDDTDTFSLDEGELSEILNGLHVPPTVTIN